MRRGTKVYAEGALAITFFYILEKMGAAPGGIK